MCVSLSVAAAFKLFALPKRSTNRMKVIIASLLLCDVVFSACIFAALKMKGDAYIVSHSAYIARISCVMLVVTLIVGTASFIDWEGR